MAGKMAADPTLIKQGISQAVDESQYVDSEDAQKKAELQTENAVKALLKEYEDARKFDKDSRARYAIDRRFATGQASQNWAVTANLIGSFIDILTSFLYARDPDVSVRKAQQIVTSG